MSILITFKAFPNSYHPAWKFSNYYVLKFCLGFESFSNQGIYHTVNRLRSSVSSCHPVSYRVNLCHPMPPCHPVSFRVIPCQSHVIKFHLVSSSVIPGQLVSSHVIKFHLVSSRVISTISSTWPQMNGWTDERIIIIIIIQLCISLRWPHGWYGWHEWLVVWRQQFRIPRDLSSETDWWNLIIIYDAINSFFLVIQQSKEVSGLTGDGSAGHRANIWLWAAGADTRTVWRYHRHWPIRVSWGTRLCLSTPSSCCSGCWDCECYHTFKWHFIAMQNALPCYWSARPVRRRLHSLEIPAKPNLIPIQLKRNFAWVWAM